MPVSAPIQTSFNAGEITPLAYGRGDFPKYTSGATLIQNFVTQIQGGLTRRTGSYYVSPTKEQGDAKLKPFVFSTGDAFMLEFGALYVRFYNNRLPVFLTGQDIAGITQANPAVLEYVGADNYANGEEIQLSDVTGMLRVNGNRYLVANVNTGANTFELRHLDGSAVDSTGYDAYVSGGTVEEVYEIVSPYSEAEVPFLRILQSRDVLYIAHPDHPPRKLSRSGATSWAFSDVVFLDGPYQKANSGATTLTPSGTSGTVTVTASAVTGINNDTGFQATDVGRLMRIKHSTTWGWGIITVVTSTTVVSVAVDADAPFGATTAVKLWRLGEWGDTNGYPSFPFSFEDRLGWGASPAEPVTLNMSKTGDYENMAPTATDSLVTADNALQLKANTKQQDPIRWVFDDEKGLVCGTKGAEFVARASTTGEAMSAVNFPALRRFTKWGSANVEPIEAGKAILFVQATKRKLREIAYAFDVDGFKSPDISVLATHATKSGMEELAFQQDPHSVVWVRRADGQLWGLTYDKEQEVIGWHRHALGGFVDAGKTEGAEVDSIATIPSPDGTQTDLWMVVRRYINGEVKRFVEYLTTFNEDYDSVEDCFFVDSGQTQVLGSSGTDIIGLDHLEGETLTALVDGSPQPDVTVAGGAVTLARAGTTIHIGFGFRSRFKSLRPEGGSRNGTAQGKTKRTHKLAGRFHQTVGVWVGRDFDNAPMDPVDFREGNHIMGAAVPLYSGDKNLDYEDDYNADGFICIETRQPLPCTLLALMPQRKVEDAL